MGHLAGHMAGGARRTAGASSVRVPVRQPSSIAGSQATAGIQRVLAMQRLAGNAAVTSMLMVQRCGPTACNCSPRQREEAEAGSLQRAIGSDFIIRGKSPDAAKPENRAKLFFDFNSSALDTQEEGKIPALAKPAARDLTLHGFVSEEGGKGGNVPLVNARIASVAKALESNQHKGQRESVLNVGKTEGTIDYRNRRVVEVTQIGSPSASADCTPDPACESTFSSALAKARFDVANARGALTDPTDPDVASALKTAFLANDRQTASKVSDKLGHLQAHFNLMATQAGHSCKTACDAGCTGGRVALTSGRKQGGGSKSHITLCPEFAGGALIAPSELLIHEGTHGAVGVLADDLAYGHSRLFEFLNPAMALENADSYMLFVRMFTTGVRGDVATQDKVAADFTGQERADTQKAIAWLDDLLGDANNTMSSNYEKVEQARAAGAWKDAGHESLMREVLAPDFQMTLPPKAPSEEDQWKVAGIADRYDQLQKVFKSPLDIRKRPAGGVVWESGPGSIVLVGPAFLIAPLEARVRQLLTAMIAAEPNISGPRKSAFVNLFFEIKQRTETTFAATEGPGANAPAPVKGPSGGGASPFVGPAPTSASRPIVRLNSTGPDVAALQQFLNAAGASPTLGPDGRFGQLTHTAVTRFQAAQGLDADGIVGPQTWSVLERRRPTAEIDPGNTFRSLAPV